jgi:hypothetical protein
MRIVQMTLTVAAIVCAGSAGVAQPAVGPDTIGWFPFALNPAGVAQDSPVDVAFLNGGPATSRIGVKDGHFANERGEAVRFLGTNVTFAGAFPQKEQAPAVAARLAQLGFNVVRFHHLDARDIWLPGQTGLDPVKLDRLDWFIFQLKQQGVYSNLNLHVSRTYPGLESLKDARAFRYGKVIDMVHRPFIEMQEQYARALLDRVNPYTGPKLSQDPAVAFVELNNENTLLALGANELAELAAAPALSESVRQQWGAWMAQRYGTVAAVEQAWNAGTQAPGEEMLRNPQFEGDLGNWTLEGQAPGGCEMARVEEGGGSVRVTMTVPGKTSWAYQVHQIGLTLAEGSTYTIRFRGRAEPARRLSVSLRLAEAPWTVLSGSLAVDLTPAWSEAVLVCQVGEIPAAPRKRLSFNLGDPVGQVWLAGASLRPGREPYQAAGAKTVAELPLPGVTTPAPGWGEFRRFLIDTERAYMSGLKGFLKDQLGVRALVCNSQASYGGYWGLWREASLGDYVDMHAYWQHPSFPGKPWDSNNWTIGNTSMVAAADGGTLPKLVAYRQAGMPFAVSEYNHPAPNDHAAELFPLACTVGALQDWDAIYQFAYCNTTDGYKPGKIGGYFELCHHPAQLVFAPLCALLYRQGLVAPAASPLTVTLPLAALESRLPQSFAGPEALLDRERLPLWAMLGNRFSVQVDPAGKGAAAEIPALPVAPSAGALIESAQVHWTPGENALFTALAPAARVAVGRLGGRSLALGDVTLKVQLPEGQWACAVLVSADGKPIAESGRVLLAVVTRAENAGMVWDEARRTLGRNWGKEPVLVQAVPFVLDGPGAPPRATALDADGKRAQTQEVATAAGGWKLTVPASTQAPWYALERP